MKSVKRQAIGFARKEYAKVKRAVNEEKAGFKVFSQQDAYFFESKITMDMKQHYCEKKAFSQLGYFPNLKEPQSLNEKIIWLALYYKNPMIARCTDKVEFKKYITEVVGADYIVPLLGVYKDVNDVPFEALPSKFVLKSTTGWGSKQVIIVDKDKSNLEKCKAKMAGWLYPWSNYYYNNMCITDEKIEPRILAEEDISINGKPPMDCKIYCCNGRAKFALIVSNRDSKKQMRSFVDVDSWEILPFKRKDINSGYLPERPNYMDELIKLAEQLAMDVPFVRVDFYICGEKYYVGEMTFSPGMFLKIEPIEWDYFLGDYVKLPDL